MPLWRVSIVDGRFGRPVGTAITWADDADAASVAVESELAGETSYGKPFVVADVQPYGSPDAHVVVIDYE